MPLFSTKKLASAQNNLGSILKNTRLKHKLKLSHVENFTNIRRSYLLAIENNNYGEFPNLEYAHKFILTYARFLELDITKINNRYQIESKHFLSQQTTNEEPVAPTRKLFILTPKTITVSLISLFILIIGYYGYLQINTFITIPKLQITEPEDYTTVNSDKINLSGQTDPENIIYINNQALTTDKNGNFTTNIQLQDGYNIIKVSAQNKLGKTTTYTKVVVADLDNTSTNHNITLTINAAGYDIWIRLKDNQENIIFDDKILAGESKKFDSDSCFYLTTSNAGATLLTVNNKPLGLIGSDNQIIDNLKISNTPELNNI
ncbi:MAG: RodZ domain-containing protein [Patescibacteria group bacterium]